MSKMKKITTLFMASVLVSSLSVAGTLAYLTDRDSVANVFTVGDVNIKLEEDFDNGATLVPGVDIEKEPTITNMGKNDAWVWAKIAVPSNLDDEDPSKNVIHFNYDKDYVNDTMWTWTNDAGEWMVAKNQKISDTDTIEYNIYTVLYQSVLERGNTTESLITKVYMDPHVDIDPEGNWHHVENGVVTDLEWNTSDGNPTIYVSAYAIQKEGFETVQDAYAAYGKQWGTNGDEWGSQADVSGTFAQEVAAGGKIVVEADEEYETATVPADKTAEINLNGNTVTGTFMNEGIASIESGTLASTSTGYGALTAIGGETTFNDVAVVTSGGGVNVWGTAVWNDGSVTTNSTSTNPRHVFYVAGGEGAKGHLTINGGEFTFSPTNLTRKGSYICAHGADATVIVNGGTFNKPSTRTAPIQEIDGATVTIYGGTFAFDPSAFVAEGYEAVEFEGWWTVSAK